MTRLRCDACTQWILILALAAAVLGCDGAIRVDGRVYARLAPDPLRPSEGAVDHAPPDTAGLLPLGVRCVDKLVT